MNITAEQVRELRERTGAGLMDCKRALEEAAGDQEKAIAILREKGLATAAKKAGRLASEGLVVSFVTPDRGRGGLVEVNCETDFVAKNAEFVAFARAVAERVAAADELGNTTGAEGEILKDLVLPDGETIGSALTALVAKIGENMAVRRFARFAVPAGGGAVETYIHMGGKIGVLIELGCTKPATAGHPSFLALAKDLAMQVAAARPEYVRREEVPAATIENERSIY
ncbi:MAG: translation elongation factor Ts, partial [Firmicutes bacterium]|nr:translation elongation factor Ts [Bacillota bacterium]